MSKFITPPRDFKEIELEMCQAVSMSCKPTSPYPAIGTVLDENMTVKWNREEVERLRAAHDQEVKALNTQKNRWRDRLEKELYERMVLELNGKITTKGAARIFAKAYEDGHAYGVAEVFIHLYNLLELFENVLSDKE